MRFIKFFTVLFLLAALTVVAENFSTTKINGITITASPGVTTTNQTKVWPPSRPYIDTADLWSTDGSISGAWQTNSAIGDTIQVFYSLTSSSGPWEPGSDPVVITTFETEFTSYVGFAEPYPDTYQPVWLYLRGLRHNGDIAFSDVSLSYIQP